MSQQNINIGTVPNDGTGDTLRNAFMKTQNNFSEFYAALIPATAGAANNVTLANNLFIGNSTVNATINSTTLFYGNSTVNTFMNSTTIGMGTLFTANSTVVNAISYNIDGTLTLNNTSFTFGNSLSSYFQNSTSVSVGNSTVNTFSNSTHFFSGNTTVYAYGNSTIELLANSSGQTVITPISWTVGNSTANATGNSTMELISNSTSQTVITPLNFSIGNSTANAFGNSVYEAIVNATANIILTPSSLNINAAAANLVVGNSTTYVIANNQGLTVGTNSFILGTSNVGHTTSLANGFIHLPGGLMMMWGALTTANNVANVQTFSTICGAAFTVNCFTAWATSNSNVSTMAITAVNSTSLTLQSNAAGAQTAYWVAVGL